MHGLAAFFETRTGQRKCAAGRARSSSDNGEAVTRDEVGDKVTDMFAGAT